MLLLCFSCLSVLLSSVNISSIHRHRPVFYFWLECCLNTVDALRHNPRSPAIFFFPPIYQLYHFLFNSFSIGFIYCGLDNSVWFFQAEKSSLNWLKMTLKLAENQTTFSIRLETKSCRILPLTYCTKYDMT